VFSLGWSWILFALLERVFVEYMRGQHGGRSILLAAMLFENVRDDILRHRLGRREK
jgi:hypothetical protein